MIDINNLNLEKFEDYGSRISRKISLHKSESFGIPPTFFKENNVEEFKFVQIFFEKEKMIIGFIFTNDENGGGYRINKYGEAEKRAANFIARSFFNKYNINAEEYSGKYDYQKIKYRDIGDMFLIEIKKNLGSEYGAKI